MHDTVSVYTIYEHFVLLSQPVKGQLPWPKVWHLKIRAKAESLGRLLITNNKFLPILLLITKLFIQASHFIRGSCDQRCAGVRNDLTATFTVGPTIVSNLLHTPII